jgi:uncharacterized protein (DUF2342 family)
MDPQAAMVHLLVLEVLEVLVAMVEVVAEVVVEQTLVKTVPVVRAVQALLFSVGTFNLLEI